MSNGEQKHALTNKFIDILYTSLAHCSFNAFTNLLPHVGPALHSKLCYMISNYVSLHHNTVHALAQFVEALCYKPEGCGFGSQWGHWNFLWHNPSVALWPCG